MPPPGYYGMPPPGYCGYPTPYGYPQAPGMQAYGAPPGYPYGYHSGYGYPAAYGASPAMAGGRHAAGHTSVEDFARQNDLDGSALKSLREQPALVQQKVISEGFLS